MNEDDLRHNDLKKTDLIKKKMFLTNKAIELFKKNDKNKVKLPEVSKINLVIENSKKDIKKESVGEIEEEFAEE
jgi:predicted peroxiredoxin